MKEILVGVVVGVLVFFGLLMVFASGTGEVELLLWFVIAIVSGVFAAKAARK